MKSARSRDVTAGPEAVEEALDTAAGIGVAAECCCGADTSGCVAVPTITASPEVLGEGSRKRNCKRSREHAP